MGKIGIVILNYLNYLDTIECVDSIRQMDYKIAGIVIVDNGSYNESYSILGKIYMSFHNDANVMNEYSFQSYKYVVWCAFQNFLLEKLRGSRRIKIFAGVFKQSV